MDHGDIVGTSSFCLSRFERFQGWGEIISIYLLPDYMGKGYGNMLMKAILSELKSKGYEDVFLWVLEENTRAGAFTAIKWLSPIEVLSSYAVQDD